MYKITINGKKPSDGKDSYEKGEKVSVVLPFVTDSNMKVFTEGVTGLREYIEGSIIYSFEMPDHDVNVEVSASEEMAKTDIPLSMGAYVVPSLIGESDADDFCPECGAIKD